MHYGWICYTFASGWSAMSVRFCDDRDTEEGVVEVIAPQLLGQPGSRFREVCIAAAIHALEEKRDDVLYADLLWAHETLLHRRVLAAQTERFMPAPARKRGGFFGKNRS